MNNNIKILGVKMVSVYVDDYKTNLNFYKNILGLELVTEMTEKSAYLKFGNCGMIIEGGHKKSNLTVNDTFPTFMLSVKSASEFFNILKKENIEILNDNPMDVGEGDFWFQFKDPSGNIIEALGGK